MTVYDRLFKLLFLPAFPHPLTRIAPLPPSSPPSLPLQVQTIATTASKEYSMLKTLEKMEHEWSGMDFRCIPYKESGTFVIGGTDEIQLILDDQIVKIQGGYRSP